MWVFNAFLYFCWLVFGAGGANTTYQEMVGSGAPCYAYVAVLADPAFPQDPSAQPGCWYDPSNVNPGTTMGK